MWPHPLNSPTVGGREFGQNPKEQKNVPIIVWFWTPWHSLYVVHTKTLAKSKLKTIFAANIKIRSHSYSKWENVYIVQKNHQAMTIRAIQCWQIILATSICTINNRKGHKSCNTNLDIVRRYHNLFWWYSGRRGGVPLFPQNGKQHFLILENGTIQFLENVRSDSCTDSCHEHSTTSSSWCEKCEEKVPLARSFHKLTTPRLSASSSHLKHLFCIIFVCLLATHTFEMHPSQSWPSFFLIIFVH